MAITYNGTNINKVTYNGTEIFGSSELNLIDHTVKPDVIHFEYTANQPIDGYVIISNSREGSDGLWAYAKIVSGVEKLTLIKQATAKYGNNKQGQSIYRLKCNTGGKIKISNTSVGAGVDDPNQGACVIMNIISVQKNA